MDTTVKHYSNFMPGAPEIDGVVGSLIDVLDACLIDGFGLTTLTSLAVANGTATATKAAHGFEAHSVIEIAGATPAGLNGEHRILTADASTFTFATSEANGSATGTITAKLPPLTDWEKAFSGTNKAVYRPTHADASGFYLRAYDTGAATGGARYGQVRAFESMSDVDTGTGPFPTTAQEASDLKIFKSYHLSTVVKDFYLIGDHRGFYLFGGVTDNQKECRAAFFFGDINSVVDDDAYACAIGGYSNAQAYTQSPGTNLDLAYLVNAGTTQEHHYLARGYDQTGGSELFGKCGDNAVTAYLGVAGPSYPHGPDGALLSAPIRCHASDKTIRGTMRGIYQPCHVRPFADGSKNSVGGTLGAKTILALGISRTTSWSNTDVNCGQILVDISGPWD